MIIANIIWPAVYYADSLTLCYVIMPSIFIEAYFFGKAFCRTNFPQGLLLSVVANFATAICGIIPIIQFSALLPTLLHDLIIHAIFSPTGWIVNAVWVIFFNTLVEYWAAKVFAKKVLYRKKLFEPDKKAWRWILFANIITFAFAMIFPALMRHKVAI